LLIEIRQMQDGTDWPDAPLLLALPIHTEIRDDRREPGLELGRPSGRKLSNLRNPSSLSAPQT
jgi:hypothetical protein